MKVALWLCALGLVIVASGCAAVRESVQPVRAESHQYRAYVLTTEYPATMIAYGFQIRGDSVNPIDKVALPPSTFLLPMSSSDFLFVLYSQVPTDPVFQLMSVNQAQAAPAAKSLLKIYQGPRTFGFSFGLPGNLFIAMNQSGTCDLYSFNSQSGAISLRPRNDDDDVLPCDVTSAGEHTAWARQWDYHRGTTGFARFRVTPDRQLHPDLTSFIPNTDERATSYSQNFILNRFDSVGNVSVMNLYKVEGRGLVRTWEQTFNRYDGSGWPLADPRWVAIHPSERFLLVVSDSMYVVPLTQDGVPQIDGAKRTAVSVPGDSRFALTRDGHYLVVMADSDLDVYRVLDNGEIRALPPVKLALDPFQRLWAQLLLFPDPVN